LGWGELVELTANPAPTVIEVLRAGLKVAQAAVVVFTPEDEARLLPSFLEQNDPPHERDLTPQPRPNVIFEAGMVMAHFPRQTVIVQIGRVRPFTDLAGIHFLSLDNSIQSRSELVRRQRIPDRSTEENVILARWSSPRGLTKFWDNYRIVSYLPTTRQRLGTSSATATVGCHDSKLALPVTL
jgi:hypothetical protein